MNRNEFSIAIENKYGLNIEKYMLNAKRENTVSIVLTTEQNRKVANIQNLEWKQLDLRAKWSLAEKIGRPFGQIAGTCKCESGRLELCGSFDYMWEMIEQILGMN